MKRLIVNADDFGLTRGVNRAIAECHAGGILTSTTLMATAVEFDEAVSIAKSLAANANGPTLSVGCHIVLVDGEPVLPPSEIRSLLAPGTKRFYPTIGQLARQAIGNRLRSEEIEAEATAQFRKIQAAGLRISHFDAHKHAHMFPGILRPVLRAAVACGIPALRNPFERPWPMPARMLFRMPVRYAEVLALRTFEPSFRQLVAEAGLKTTDGSLGVVATGALDVAALQTILGRMLDGIWELVCHPGYNDEQLAGAGTRLLASRDTEREALMAQTTRMVIERNGIALMSFAELSRASLEPGPRGRD